MIQGTEMDMLRMAKNYAVREPQNMFHGLVEPAYIPQNILRTIYSKGLHHT